MNRTIADVDSMLKIGNLVKLRLPAIGALQGSRMPDDGFRVYGTHVQDILPKAIVVAWPSERGLLVPVVVGDSVVLQMGSPQGLLLLDSTIIAKSLQPVPVLNIERMGKWSRGQLRHNVRLEIIVAPHQVLLAPTERGGHQARTTSQANPDLNTSEDDKLEGTPIDVVIRNLSAGGVQLASKTPLERGGIIKLSFSLGKGQRVITTDARIVWAGEGERETKYCYKVGCQFINLGTRDQDDIIKFVFAKQAEFRRRGLL